MTDKPDWMHFSHYTWLDDNLVDFCAAIDLPDAQYSKGLISAHGDKCYSYRDDWEDAGIPFEHGVAIYLLTYVRPYSKEVRETESGWVDVSQWIIENYGRFKENLPPAFNRDE